MRTWFARLLIALAVVAIPMSDVSPAGADSFTDTSEQIFLDRINGLRASRGLRPLAVDGELKAIAQRWAGHMAAAGGLSHNMNLPNEVRSPWTKVGENVGAGFDSGEIFDAFVNSPTHLANLVEGSYDRVGIAVVVGGDGRMYTAHEFKSTPGARKAAKPAKKAKRAPVRRAARRR